MNPGNQKFEITDIAHPEYPFLHRIRALRDIGKDVKVGDLGGFVEGGHNLSHEDDAWIYDDAIAANGAFVYEGAVLRSNAIVCGEAHVCKEAVLSGHARVEDHARMDGGRVEDCARLSGHGMAAAITPSKYPVLSGECIVHGIVTGNVLVTSQAVVLGDEKIVNEALDRLVVTERGRSIERSPDRDRLVPGEEYFARSQPKRKQGHKRKEAQR